MTPGVCAVCGIDQQRAIGAVLLQHVQKVGSRWVEWRECKDCNESEDKRMVAVLAQAERAGA